MKRVLLTRAREDGERTAAKLRAMDHEPLLSPVLEIAPTGARLPDGPFDGVIVTSAHAIRCAGPEISKLAPAPLYVVGERTARAATQAGLRVAATAPDVARLAAALREMDRAPSGAQLLDEAEARLKARAPMRFLYLAGRDRKSALERALREDGREIATVEVYEARAASTLSDEAVAALARGDIDAALHYSPRSAAIALDLAAKAGLLERLCKVPHLALSEDVARPLRQAGCARVLVAQAPDEERLLRLLSEL